jgi:hypothetical protein
MYYRPRHFVLQELVPKEVFDVLGEKAWILLDGRILWTLDALRDKIGVALTVNDWSSGGNFQQRGFRTVAIDARYSQHMRGAAADFDIQGIAADDFRQRVRGGHFGKELKYITRIEDNVNWIHIDTADVDRRANNGIIFFNGF